MLLIVSGPLLGEVDDNAEQHLDKLDLVLHRGEAVRPEESIGYAGKKRQNYSRKLKKMWPLWGFGVNRSDLSGGSTAL